MADIQLHFTVAHAIKLSSEEIHFYWMCDCFIRVIYFADARLWHSDVRLNYMWFQLI